MSQPQKPNLNPELEYHRHAGSVAKRQCVQASIALGIVRESPVANSFPRLSRRLREQRSQFRRKQRYHYGIAELLERSAA